MTDKTFYRYQLLIFIIAVGAILILAHEAKAQQQSYRARAWNIISHVFPPATRAKAFAVAECETVHFTDFYNNRSGAADLFQEMPGNNGRVFHFNGQSMTLNYSRLTRTDHGHPTWYAARVAYFQSSGGWNWGEWDCG